MLGTRKSFIVVTFIHWRAPVVVSQLGREFLRSLCSIAIACTFLGPSRKRGPPKGYIDAIEARLHQTEALVGIMLATKDPRAHSLLEDLAKVSFTDLITSSRHDRRASRVCP